MLENRKPRIGWILAGDHRFGSSRIHGYNIHDYLLTKGINSRIVSSPAIANCALQVCVLDRLKLFASCYDLVIFQKVYDYKAVAFAGTLKKLGVKTVFLLCDLVETPMIHAVDHIIVTSQALAAWVYKQFGVVAEVIDDAIEIPDNFRAMGSGASLPTGVWVGSRDNWEGISRIIRLIKSCGLDKVMEIVTISDHKEATVAWSQQNVLENCRFADFSLLPVDDTFRASVKSSNRLSMFLSMGLPVLAERTPAYEDLAARTGGVVFADNDEDWCSALENIQHQRYRAELVGDAANKVRELLDISVIGERWFDYLSVLLAHKAR